MIQNLFKEALIRMPWDASVTTYLQFKFKSILNSNNSNNDDDFKFE